MKSKIFYSGNVDSAHFVPMCNTKCENIHGHTWKVEIEIIGEVQKDGMVIDFGKIKELLDSLDHNVLNEEVFTPVKINHIELGRGWFVKNIMNDVIEQPTAELMSKYIFDVIMKITNATYCSVKIYEGEKKGAEFNTGLLS